MQINDEFTLKVEKLINEGFGLARISGMPIFIKGAVPQDILKVKIVKINKSYITAQILEILEPSKYRINPVCSLHNVCGGCGWQNIAYEEQLKQKQNILAETIHNITGISCKIEPVIPSPKITEYRCKVQYPVSQKATGRIVGGYYKQNTHELINVKYCFMHNPLINNVMEFIKEQSFNFHISAYDEKTHSGLLRHIIIRESSSAGNIVIIFVINDNKIQNSIKSLAECVSDKFSFVTGICVNFNTKNTNVIMGEKTVSVVGSQYYEETIGNLKYRISPQSFFQVNPYSAGIMFNKVKEIISQHVKMPSIIDAYAGVSSFGIWLSDIASRVVSVEEVVSASDDAAYNAKLNNIANIEIINGDAAKIFDDLIKKSVKFDVSLIDPPRKGASLNSLNALVALTNKYIVYVSCNPATLARDIKILSEYSFTPELVQPVDMFPNTPHIETIAFLKHN